MSFTQFKLDSRLNQGINFSGYKTPTPIQQSAIPLALAGHDIIGTAQTGTGKTAAFVLPILHKLLNGSPRKARALIITPTRELAEQIHQSIKDLSKGTQIRSMTIFGGVGANPQISQLRRGVNIIIACPGRLLDLHSKGHVNLKDIEVLVLDEADRMMDMGFLPDIKRIIKLVPVKRQTLLFSATFPEEIEKLARKSLTNPKKVAVGIVAPAHTVSHTLYPVKHHIKKGLVLRLLEQTDTNSVLIFTRTKHRAKRLAQQIAKKGYKVTSLHGNRSQNQRQSALKGFKDGRYQIMVATDIAARGLDIESISHVINFDMPDTEDAYIHRIGRTGRAKRSGEAFTLVTPDDDAMVRRIERVMNEKLERRTLEDFDYDVPMPDYPKNNRRSNGRKPAVRANGKSNGNGNASRSNGSGSRTRRTRKNRGKRTETVRG